MSADIKDRVSKLPDEEILKMLTTHFPDYRKEWINISQEELSKRGFVLEPTETELRVITPAGRKLVYPKIQSDVGAIAQVKRESAEPEKFSNRAFVILAIAVVMALLAYFLVAPGNATVGYHVASVIIKLISYSIILFAIAAVIAAAMGKFKTHALTIFGWLFLAAAIFDFGVAAYRKFVIEPQVRRALERMERRR
jgi:hypothetical protein